MRTSQETHYATATQTNRLMLLQETMFIVRTIRNTQLLFVPHRKHVMSPLQSRLMLFGETVTVYCENHMEHTVIGRTSQETRYVSATEIKWLMLF
jgi:hypothetical protein